MTPRRSFAARITMALVSLVLAFESTGIASVGPRQAAYVGGTVAVLGAVPDRIEGYLKTTDDVAVVFNATEPAASNLAVSIPYAQITGIRYGQKAGRRIGTTIGVSVVAGPVGLLTLLSKKREHFVTLEYTATDGSSQVAVFEIGKDSIRSTLIALATRTGKQVVFLDNNAREGW
jgi:hypothetical protein